MKYLFLLPVVFVLWISCSSGEGEDSPILKDIQNLLPHNPDSALRLIKINNEELFSGKENAFTVLMNYYICDLIIYDFCEDSLLVEIMQNDHYYTNDYYEALACYYRAIFLLTKSEYEKAMEFFHRAEDMANNKKWNYLLGMIYNQSARIFYELALYNASIEYADKSFYSFIAAGDSVSANRSLGNKIFSLFELQQDEQAYNCYQFTKQQALKTGDLEYLKDICAEQLSIFLFYKYSCQADRMYEDLQEIRPENYMLPVEYLYLGDKYTRTGRLDSAYYYLLKADEKAIQTYDRILLTSLFSDYYRKKGDYKTSIEYLDEQVLLFDSIVSLTQKASLVKVESRARNLKEQLKYEKKVKEQRDMVYRGTVVLFLVILFLIIYQNKIKKQRNEIYNRLAIASEVVSDLEKSNHTLLSKLNIHKEKENQLKEHIESKLLYARMFADLYYKFPDKPATILKKMNEMIDLVPTNKEFAINIINNVNLYYNNAIEKLTLQHANLTNAEILFSALIIAGFSMQEMSLILNCNSVDAVYTRKYRLKQKLDLNKDTDVEEYLAGFVKA